MPNLRPPITTTAAAVTYRDSIIKAMQDNTDFTPLMTLYLTDKTTPDEIKLARESGVVYGVKLYPAGATTNSQDGVTDLFGKCVPVLEEMINQNIPLLVFSFFLDLQYVLGLNARNCNVLSIYLCIVEKHIAHLPYYEFVH